MKIASVLHQESALFTGIAIVFKEDERGVAIMCHEMEIMRNQAHEEGVEEGRRLLLIEQVCAKMQKFSSAEEIADDLTIRDVL